MSQPQIMLGAEAGKLSLMFRALRIRNYRLFWTGWLLSNIGTWMQAVALGWLVLQLTNSPFLLGFVGFSGTLPVLVFSLIGGVYADILDRRKLLMIMQTVLMILAFLLGALTTLQVVNIWHIIAISTLSGTASAISMPAYQAMVLDLVGREDLMNAIALNSMQFNLSRVIGPSIAGVALGAIGTAGCFYLNGLSFLAVIFALMLITSPTVQGPSGEGSVWERFIEGMQYAISHRVILCLLSIVAAGSLFGMPYITLLPIFARDILHRGAAELGYLMSASGTGAVLGALVLALLGDFPFKGKFLVAGSLLFASCIAAFALSKNYYVSLVLLSLVGWSMVSSVAVVNTLLQKLVPNHIRGRIMSMHALAFLGMTPIGNLVAGSTAQVLGAPFALAAGGIVIGSCVLYIVLTNREILDLK